MFPNVVLRDHSLSPHARLLYALLVDYARRDEAWWPGQPKLASYLSVQERQLRRYTSELELAQLVETRRRGQGQTNAYILLDLPVRSALTGQERSDIAGLERSDMTAIEEQRQEGVEAAASTPGTNRERTTATQQSEVDGQAIDELSDELRPFVEPVRDRLARVAATKDGAISPSLAAVARLLGRFPRKDFIRHADDFEHWAVHGRGRGRKMKDVVAAYRNWIARELDVIKKTPAPGMAAGRSLAAVPDDTAERLREAER
jgi:hypothetical protein